MSPAGQRKPRVALPAVLVVVAAVVVLLGIIVANLVTRGPRCSQQNACINNLRMIDAGKEQAALAYRWAADQPCITTVVNQYIKGNTTPLCPCGGEYTYGAMNVQPTCNFRGSTTHRLPNGY